MTDHLRRALVTGASHGIGRAIAEHLATKGFDLVISARSDEELQDLAVALSSSGTDVRVIAGDIRESEVLDRLEAAAADALNVAFFATGAIVDPDAERSVTQLDVGRVAEIFNVTTVYPIDLYRRTFRALKARQGTAFFVASDWALPGSDGPSVFSASKAALLHFVRTERASASASGVTLSCLVPGDIATYDRDWSTPTWTLADPSSRILEEFKGQRISLHDVVAAVDFILASESARIHEVHMSPLSEPEA
jgi:short-subunit dehydrogenase